MYLPLTWTVSTVARIAPFLLADPAVRTREGRSGKEDGHWEARMANSLCLSAFWPNRQATVLIPLKIYEAYLKQVNLKIHSHVSLHCPFRGSSRVARRRRPPSA